jgi:hypothetical protein
MVEARSGDAAAQPGPAGLVLDGLRLHQLAEPSPQPPLDPRRCLEQF